MNPLDVNISPEGYKDIQRVHKNQRHDIRKAIRAEDGQQVALKSTYANEDFLRNASKLGHEFDILKGLEHPGVPAVYDLIHQADALILVQEFIEGSLLRERLFKGKIPVLEVLEIAIKLVDILIYLHEKGIVHKDLSSSNIILGDDGSVKLIDYGISSNLHFEQNESVVIDHIEGTLTHIAPEQTGRTAFSVTQSSDLYSMGILLYELLTGKPPFDSSDALEIIHFHLSRKPAALSKVLDEVPFGLEQVVNKLLQKNPDDRYQRARGLKEDLLQLQAIAKGKKKESSFELGKNDKLDHYKQTQKLYGREKELASLLDYYRDLDKHRSRLVLVAGYSGVGKSALIDNVKYPIIQDHGLFITGKFDQYKKNIPYYAFIEAFEQLIRTLLAEPDEIIEEWKRRIIHALGENGGLITEVIPLLNSIVGKQEQVSKLQPAEQEARFNRLLLDFVYAFSSPKSPLVIFLDDLQWADLPSLNLLKMILENPRKEGLMIIGAYRDNEVDETHPLSVAIRELKKQKTNIQSLFLKPLNQETTAQITADSFGMEESQAAKLSSVVFDKTKGNPFFINRFLKLLYDNEYVQKDVDGKWIFDTDQIDTLDYTDNVVDLMIEELISIPEESRNAVKYASVLGNSFDLEDLSTIVGLDQGVLYKDLRPALRKGYLTPNDKKYRSLSIPKLEGDAHEDGPRVGFRFTHDKVQQAAYALISDFERERVHLETGRLLLSNTSEEELQEDVFELLNHFAIGEHLIKDEEEKKRIAKLCLLAGRKAKDSTSYDLAVSFLSMARSLIGKGSWDEEYKLNFDVVSELGECLYLNGIHDKAENCFHEVMQYARSRFEKLQILYVHSSLYLKEGNTNKSLRIGLEAVKLYNIRFPSHPKVIEAKAALQMVKYILLFSTKYRNTESLFNIPDCTEEERVTLNKFLIDLATSAYQQDQNLMMLVIFKIIESYLKHGFTDASGWGFSGFSVVMLSVIKMQKRGFYLWEITERMHRRTHSPIIKWRLGYTVRTFYYPWSRPIKEIFPETVDMIQACVSNGDQIFTGYSIAMYQRQRWFASVKLQSLLDPKENFKELLREARGGEDFFIGGYQMIRALAGATGTPAWDDEQFSGTETYLRLVDEGNKTKLAFFTIAQITMLYYFGHFREAIDLSKVVKDDYLENVIGDLYEFDYAFYTAMSIAANYELFEQTERPTYLKIFKKHLKDMRYWTKGFPANFESHLSLVEAEFSAMTGDVETAVKGYEQTMELASKGGYTNVEAIANERAAKYSFDHGFNKQARNFLIDAYESYRHWGAMGKCKQLEQSFPSLLRASTNEGFEQHGSSTTRTSSSSVVALDLSTILKASQSIASQTKYDELLKNLMDIVIENAGAERGALILERKGDLTVEVEAFTGKKGTKILNSLPLESYGELPQSLIKYTWRSEENVVVSDAQTDERFQGDPYIINQNVLSTLCIPLTEKGRTIGLLYLENNLMKGVFDERRLELLDMLSGQIGISIENALLIENLEEKVQERTKELQEEKEKSDHLLLNILPKKIANELKTTGRSDARSYKNATVMFCDIVGFTHLGEKLDAKTLVENLHEFFSGIDDILIKHKVEKIKTIGDAYLCASGLNESENGESANDMLYAAVEIIAYLKELNKAKSKEDRLPFELRIGIHTGPVVAGVVGKAKFAYDIWGDTVNTAARMESHGEPMRINVSQETYQLVRDNFDFEHRGKIEAKNKGLVDMYFVQ